MIEIIGVLVITLTILKVIEKIYINRAKIRRFFGFTFHDVHGLDYCGRYWTFWGRELFRRTIPTCIQVGHYACLDDGRVGIKWSRFHSSINVYMHRDDYK